jgi:hypothetical protein
LAGDAGRLGVKRGQRALQLLCFLVGGLRRLLALADLAEDAIEKISCHACMLTDRQIRCGAG